MEESRPEDFRFGPRRQYAGIPQAREFKLMITTTIEHKHEVDVPARIPCSGRR
jgi:hypothetical protein